MTTSPPLTVKEVGASRRFSNLTPHLVKNLGGALNPVLGHSAVYSSSYII
jgi:hypothetical protein